MGKIVRLTESDLVKLVKKVIKEQDGLVSTGINYVNKLIEKTYIGKKINLLNRMFIYSKEMETVNIRGGMTNYNEDISLNQFDCSPILISVTPDAYYVKVDYLSYDPKDERKRGEKGEYKNLNNVCLKIPKNQVISFEDGVMQVRWYNSFVENRKIDCNSIPTSGEGKKESTQGCLKDFKIEINSHPVFGEYKVATRNDGVQIFFDKEKNKWNDTYENKKGKKPGDMLEVGKWKCQDGIFVMYDKRQKMFTIN